MKEITIKKSEFKDRRGNVQTSYRYWFGGKLIASRYEGNEYSTADLNLRTDYIGHDFARTAYERALSCDLADIYRELFQMLGINETSRLAEFTNG